jgi:hypothetical protein
MNFLTLRDRGRERSICVELRSARRVGIQPPSALGQGRLGMSLGGPLFGAQTERPPRGGPSDSGFRVARAQQGAMPVIGFLHPGSIEPNRRILPAFHRGLADTGLIDGRNVGIEYRWAAGRNDRLPALALDLVRRRVAVRGNRRGTAAGLRRSHGSSLAS